MEDRGLGLEHVAEPGHPLLGPGGSWIYYLRTVGARRHAMADNGRCDLARQAGVHKVGYGGRRHQHEQHCQLVGYLLPSAVQPLELHIAASLLKSPLGCPPCAGLRSSSAACAEALATLRDRVETPSVIPTPWPASPQNPEREAC